MLKAYLLFQMTLTITNVILTNFANQNFRCCSAIVIGEVFTTSPNLLTVGEGWFMAVYPFTAICYIIFWYPKSLDLNFWC